MEVDTFWAQHAVAVLWHAQKVIARSDLVGKAQDSGWTQRNGTNGHDSLVPFLPVPQGRIGLRHSLSYSVSPDWNLKPRFVYKG